MDDEFGLALLRDRLRDPFGGFSGGVVAEFLPNVGAYEPVVEVVVRDNVNSSGCHRLSSANNEDWQRIGDGAVTSVNFGAIEKSGEADSRQWVKRELIKARTAEGRDRAKSRGVRMGRKHKLTPHQQAEVRKRKAEGQSVRELGRSYNVSPNTISRIK